MALNLRGRIAVVTGASSGIGEATARALATAGMTVVATARRTERLEKLAGDHAGIVAHTADMTSDDDVAGLAARVDSEFGACHVLVNNAGDSFARQLRGPDDLDVFRRMIDLNLMGPVRCMTAFADVLFRSAPGRVINVGSVAGKVGVGSPAYVASKFALVGLSEAARADWGRRGIAVSQVNPGFVRTEGFPQDRLVRSTVGRWLVTSPEKVAGAIVDVARSGAPERTVPRWYRTATLARHLVPPAYWAAGRRTG